MRALVLAALCAACWGGAAKTADDLTARGAAAVVVENHNNNHDMHVYASTNGYEHSLGIVVANTDATFEVQLWGYGWLLFRINPIGARSYVMPSIMVQAGDTVVVHIGMTPGTTFLFLRRD